MRPRRPQSRRAEGSGGLREGSPWWRPRREPDTHPQPGSRTPPTGRTFVASSRTPLARPNVEAQQRRPLRALLAAEIGLFGRLTTCPTTDLTPNSPVHAPPGLGNDARDQRSRNLLLPRRLRIRA